MILLASDISSELGVEGVRLRLGSLGTPAARAAYLETLRGYLRAHEAELSEEVREPDRRPIRCAPSTRTTRAPAR